MSRINSGSINHTNHINQKNHSSDIFPLDFTPATYKHLIETLKLQGFWFITLDAYFRGRLPGGPFVMLRHDVDARYPNALRMAEIEHQMGIVGTYYFRIMNGQLNRRVIEKIASLGHEIGMHYEDLSIARGNHSLAIQHFLAQLQRMRQLYPTKTICMHGSPLSRYDNRDLWTANAAASKTSTGSLASLEMTTCEAPAYDYKHYGIIGEPYFDVDFSQVLYLTDTGRRWDGEKVSVRDKPSHTIANTGRTGAIPVETHGRASLQCRSTNHIIAAARQNRLPDQVMLTIHPQRWTDKPLPWLQELLWQNVKNVVKWLLVAWR